MRVGGAGGGAGAGARVGGRSGWAGGRGGLWGTGRWCCFEEMLVGEGLTGGRREKVPF